LSFFHFLVREPAGCWLVKLVFMHHVKLLNGAGDRRFTVSGLQLCTDLPVELLQWNTNFEPS